MEQANLNNISTGCILVHKRTGIAYTFVKNKNGYLIWAQGTDRNDNRLFILGNESGIKNFKIGKSNFKFVAS